MFHRVKSFAEVPSKKANCFTIGAIQVAVDPMLNWQESIGTVSSQSSGSKKKIIQTWAPFNEREVFIF